MTSLRALLFDFDGTLVDSERANLQAYETALSALSLPFTPLSVDAIAGQHWSSFLPRALGDRYTEDVGRLVAARKSSVYPEFFDRIVLNEGLVRLARTVKDDVRRVIVTNASRASVLAILDHFRIRGLFDLVIAQEDCDEKKPLPGPYLVALARLSLSADECLAFEDSAPGIAAARAAGLPVVVLGRGSFGSPS